MALRLSRTLQIDVAGWVPLLISWSSGCVHDYLTLILQFNT